MGLTRRIEFTVAARQTLVVRRSTNDGQLCAECAAPSQMLTPIEAAALAGLGQRELFRQIEAGLVHYAEMPEGALLICVASLPAPD